MLRGQSLGIACEGGVRLRPVLLCSFVYKVTVSAINRNYKGRLYLAFPLTVAASAFKGEITAYRPGMFSSEEGSRQDACAPS